jgi:hypothetical protein
VWVPKDTAEIEAAARRGELEETPSFDAKADLPVAKKNASLAVDVAAMSTDGGVLLYGIAEDASKRPTVIQPITLAGAADRIDQIVSNGIAEVPYIDPREYPCAGDPSKGYVLLIIPPSPRAPHQVIVGNEWRFYGRGAKGNRILTEGEVARLYRRREEWEQDQSVLLAEAVAAAPFEPQSGLAYLHAFARPVPPDRAIWDRAVESAGGRDALHKLMADVAGAVGPHDGYAPNLKSGPRWRRQGADSWRLSSTHERDYCDARTARYIVNVTVNIDGRGHLFDGRAAEATQRSPGDQRLIIWESGIAGNFAGFLAAMGALYRAGGYHGQVDIGIACTGLEGGQSSLALNPHYIMFTEDQGFNEPTYTRTERVAAAELVEPEPVARRMLRHLFEAVTRQDDFDPFA